jgi:hypothetical protein
MEAFRPRLGHRGRSVVSYRGGSLSITIESKSRLLIAEPSIFSSVRGRIGVFVVAQIPLLFCIPIWTSGREIEALLLACFWILGAFWFCGAQIAIEVDEESRSIRRSRRFFSFTFLSETYSIQNGDYVYLVLRQDGEDRVGQHRLYICNCRKKIYLLDLDSSTFGYSQSLLRRLQNISDLLRIENCGYQ